MRLDSSKRLGCSESEQSAILEELTTTGRERPRLVRALPQSLRSNSERISMPRVESVEDPEDPRLIDYREIRDAERRRQSGTFIAAGRELHLPGGGRAWHGRGARGRARRGGQEQLDRARGPV